jgi:hypothetical protein
MACLSIVARKINDSSHVVFEIQWRIVDYLIRGLLI